MVWSVTEVKQKLLSCMELLQQAHLHFGYEGALVLGETSRRAERFITGRLDERCLIMVEIRA